MSKIKVLIETAVILVIAGMMAVSCSKADNPVPDPDPDPPVPDPDTMVFVHPGVTVTNDDIARMRTMVASQISPAYETYQALKLSPYASADYQMRGPYSIISRDATRYPEETKHEMDMTAAYLNAIEWCVEQDEKYAAKALDIIWQYAQTLTAIDTDTGVILVSGFAAFHIIKTMEILRYTYTVPQEKLSAINTMLTDIFLPVMVTDLEKSPYHIGNQDAVGNRAIMALAVYNDDSELYQWAKTFILDGDHNGCMKNYILASTGQCQESGRDQRHTQLGLGAMIETCEIAHKQGDDDLFSAHSNLMLTGFEYTAKYNIGLSVPFEVMSDVTGRSDWAYKSISTEGRGTFLPYYEIVYNHYIFRKGLIGQADMTTYVLEDAGDRPETILADSNLQHTYSSLVYYQSK